MLRGRSIAACGVGTEAYVVSVFEFILGWRFVPKAFEVGDELTATFKPRRHVITEKYAALIDNLFQQSRGTRRH